LLHAQLAGSTPENRADFFIDLLVSDGYSSS
jgi:hypothetical protein